MSTASVLALKCLCCLPCALAPLSSLGIVLNSCVYRLANNPVGEQGAQYLAEALAGNRSLTHLSLLHTALGDRGAEVIAQHLAKNQHLQELNLGYNSLTDAAALHVVEVAKKHATLDKVQ